LTTFCLSPPGGESRPRSPATGREKPKLASPAPLMGVTDGPCRRADTRCLANSLGNELVKAETAKAAGFARIYGMTVAQIGPYSRPHMLAKIDGRTKESRLMAAARAELTRHVGGSPSHVQRVLIERAARLMLYVEIMDRETLEAGTMSERNSRQYLAWSNSLRLTLRELGVKAAPTEKPPDLRDILAEHGTAR
jgi:hypothetical protein